MSDRKLVRYRTQDGVAYLTLDDPPANTYTHEMMRQLDDAIIQARFDKDVSVLVLTGLGEKFFCAGANINMLQTSDPYFKYYFCLHANETLNRLEHTPKLVIAALNGHTVGGGLETSDPVGDGVGEGSPHVPEGLALVQFGQIEAREEQAPLLRQCRGITLPGLVHLVDVLGAGKDRQGGRGRSGRGVMSHLDDAPCHGL